MRRILVLALVVSTTACQMLSSAEDIKPTRVVLNALKDELALFQSTTPAGGNACMENGTAAGTLLKVVIKPLTAKLALKVIAGAADTAGATAKLPIGGIITANFGGVFEWKSQHTQTVTFDLGIAHEPTVKELRANASSLAKEVDEDAKAKANFVNEPELQARVDNAAQEKRKGIVELYRKLYPGAETATPATADVAESSMPSSLDGHEIATALWVARNELLHVDHGKKPCFKPSQLTVEIAFQVITKRDVKGGFGANLGFIVVDASAAENKTDDRTQTLTVTFDMADESSLIK